MAGNRLKLNMNKTELLWAGTRRLLQDFTFPSLQLAVDVITPKQHFRVLGVVVSDDLSIEKHATNRVHSKLKGQNSRNFQGLLKDLKLHFSSTKSIDKMAYHTRTTSKFRVKYILYTH